MKQTKFKAKPGVVNPYKVFRRTTDQHPWKLICATNQESMARVSYSQCGTRYPGQEIKVEGFDVSNVGDTVQSVSE
jgi:hypothetical protein